MRGGGTGRVAALITTSTLARSIFSGVVAATSSMSIPPASLAMMTGAA